MKKLLIGSLVTATLAGSALAVSAVPASADVVCNRYGECWRVRDRYDYPTGPTFSFTVHDDRWYRHHRHDRHWRWRHDRYDRGYWEHGRWHRF
jgi:hypothetical protein